MKKIVLINTRSPETFWTLKGTLEITKKKSHIPPLGLATIAALTPPEFQVEIIDEEVEDIDFDMKCDMVGITGYTLHSKRMIEISAEFQKRGVVTVGGGPYCSAHSEESSAFFDVIISGEGEYVWGQFLSDWEKGKFSKLYKSDKVTDMSDSPVPRWDSVKFDEYSGAVVQTSRGCPYDCEFCDVVSLFGRKTRHKPVDHVIKEVKTLVELGRFDIFFADDNFIGNKKFAREILRQLIELNRKLKQPVRFITQITLNVAQDPELLSLFKEANFFCFFIGIESPKEENLIMANKQHNLKFDMTEAVRRIQSHGIFIISAMIVGFDSDGLEVFQIQETFLREAGLTIAFVGMLMAPKGTKLWDRLEKEGRLLPQSETGDMFLSTNIVPKLVEKKVFERSYHNFIKELYSHSQFLKRFECLIGQLDGKAIKKNSPLATQVKISNFRFYFLGVTFRLFKHYLFCSGKRQRMFFLSVLAIAFKKGLVCLPWVIELLIYFKAQKEFVERHVVSSEK